MNTLAIIAKHKELYDREIRCLIDAMPSCFKDKDVMARLEFAKKKLIDFEETEWVENV